MHSLTQYKDQVQVELTGDILPFYMRIGIDEEQDGFHGRIANDLTVERDVPKGLVQHSMLEAYSNLLRAWELPQLRDRLRALIQIMLEHIIDQERGQMKMHFTVDW